MNTLVKRFGLLCVASAGFSATVSHAQTKAATEATSATPALEEVIVTAQKKEERIMDVPTQITAVKAQELMDQNLLQVRDYFSRIPDLQYQGDRTYQLSLRGITTGGGTNPTLAVLVDDVQFGSSTFLGLGNSRFPDFDPSMLERVEVLRGPQGTLYGASSLGGLIKYVTRKPDTNNWSARVELGANAVEGGTSGWTARGFLNMPLVQDKLALSVGAFTRQDPPYIDNVRTGFEGDNVNKAHTYGAQAALLWKPLDNLTVSVDALRQKRNGDFGSGIQVLTDSNGYPTFVPCVRQPGQPCVASGSYRQISSTTASDVGDQQFLSGRIEYTAGGITFTSLTAWNKSDGTNNNDLSTVFFFIPLYYGQPPGSASTVILHDAQSSKKFSQEFRIAGKLDRLDWRVGYFYTKEDGSVDQIIDAFDPSGAVLGAPAYHGSGPVTYKENAVFADGTFKVTDQFSIQVGVRHAKNDQSYLSNQFVDAPLVSAFGPTSSTPVFPSSDTATTWELAPSYHFNPDVMLYARVATGYRPGGPNTQVGTIPPTFEHDTVTNYELGLKGVTPDRKFGWDAALFQVNWKNIQLQDTDSATQFIYFTNGGTARSRGLEASVNWQPATGLTINANATILDAALSSPLPALSGADSLVGQSGDRLPGSARFTGNLSVRQQFPLSGATSGYVEANWSYIGARESEFVNSSAVPTPRFSLPSYSGVDLTAGFEFGKQWQLIVYGRNIFNEHGVVIANNRNGTSSTIVNFLQPLTYGATVSFKL